MRFDKISRGARTKRDRNPAAHRTARADNPSLFGASGGRNELRRVAVRRRGWRRTARPCGSHQLRTKHSQQQPNSPPNFQPYSACSPSPRSRYAAWATRPATLRSQELYPKPKHRPVSTSLRLRCRSAGASGHSEITASTLRALAEIVSKRASRVWMISYFSDRARSSFEPDGTALGPAGPHVPWTGNAHAFPLTNSAQFFVACPRWAMLTHRCGSLCTLFARTKHSTEQPSESISI